MKIIQTERAPSAIGPYSQAITHNGLVYASGQVGISPEGVRAVGIASETRQALDNLGAVLEASSSGFHLALKVTVYLKDMADFQEVNQIYAEYFGDHRPARACVQAAALPKDTLVEIDCIAATRQP